MVFKYPVLGSRVSTIVSLSSGCFLRVLNIISNDVQDPVRQHGLPDCGGQSLVSVDTAKYGSTGILSSPENFFAG